MFVIPGLSRFDDIVQGLQRLLNWRLIIPAMNLVEIHIIHIQAAQAGIDLVQNSPA
jgi:hypothetical protein